MLIIIRNKAPFSFGTPNVSGQQQSQQTQPIQPTSFGFGVQSTQPNQGATVPSTGFGMAGGFGGGTSFGSTQPASGSFGQPPSTGSVFGQPPSTTGSYGSGMNTGFGQNKPAFGTTANTSPFAPKPMSTGFGFGQSQVPSATGFGGGATTTTTAPAFGSGFGTTTNQPSANVFGQPAQPTAIFGQQPASFGQQPSSAFGSLPTTSTETSTTSGFGFGGSTITTPSTGFSGFGTFAPATTAAAPVPAPVFGQPLAPSAAPAGFGSISSTTTTAPTGGAFGAGTLGAGTIAAGNSGGFSFGAPSSAAPAFGHPASSTVASIATPTTAPAATPAPAPAANTFNFGTSATVPAAPTFGAGGFGQSPSSTAISRPAAPMPSFSFGAPAANPTIASATAQPPIGLAPAKPDELAKTPAAGFNLSAATTQPPPAAASGFSFNLPITKPPTTEPTKEATKAPAFEFRLPGAAAPTPTPAASAEPAKPPTFTFGAKSIAPESSKAIEVKAPKAGENESSTPLGTDSSKPAAPVSIQPQATTLPSNTQQSVASIGALASTTPAAFPSSLKNKTLEEIVIGWNEELENQVEEFQRQAINLSRHDLRLISNGDSVLKINEGVQKSEILQKELEQNLAYVAAQQSELEALLDGIEKELPETVKDGEGEYSRRTINDPLSGKTFELAESLQDQVMSMAAQLKSIVEELNAHRFDSFNSTASQSSSKQPIVEVVQILNAHLESLQWVDQHVTELQKHVEETKVSGEKAKIEQERMAYSRPVQ